MRIPSVHCQRRPCRSKDAPQGEPGTLRPKPGAGVSGFRPYHPRSESNASPPHRAFSMRSCSGSKRSSASAMPPKCVELDGEPTPPDWPVAAGMSVSCSRERCHRLFLVDAATASLRGRPAPAVGVGLVKNEMLSLLALHAALPASQGAASRGMRDWWHEPCKPCRCLQYEDICASAPTSDRGGEMSPCGVTTSSPHVGLR